MARRTSETVHVDLARYTDALGEHFRTQSFLRIESTAVQRCARKSSEIASR